MVNVKKTKLYQKQSLSFYKKQRKILVFPITIILLSLILVVYGCENQGSVITSLVVLLIVTPADEIDLIGDQRQFTATGTYDNGSTQDITSQVDWTSSNVNVATIAASGEATAQGGGFTTITATEPDSGVSGSVIYGIEYNAEGTISAPREIEDVERWEDPTEGKVGTGWSYYKVSDMISATYGYTVSLTEMNDDVDLYVYGEDGTYTTWIERPFYGRTADEEVPNIYVVDGQELYIAVDGSYSKIGSTYFLKVAPSPGQSSTQPPPVSDEGSVADPVEIPLNEQKFGMVGDGSSYYYADVSQGTRYAISISDALGGEGSPNPNLYIYNGDASFTNLVSQTDGPGADDVYAINASGEKLHFAVRNDGEALSGDGYNIRILSAEGTSAEPVSLYGEKTNPGNVNDVMSYYALSVESGETYTVTLSVSVGDIVELQVYNDDSTFTTVQCSDTPEGRNPATCTDVVAAGDTFYVGVDGSIGSTGAIFEFAVYSNDEQ